MMNVEVQFRTIAMDFWASVEHKLKYKKEIASPELFSAKLEKCASDLALIDPTFSMRDNISFKITKKILPYGSIFYFL